MITKANQQHQTPLRSGQATNQPASQPASQTSDHPRVQVEVRAGPGHINSSLGQATRRPGDDPVEASHRQTDQAAVASPFPFFFCLLFLLLSSLPPFSFSHLPSAPQGQVPCLSISDRSTKVPDIGTACLGSQVWFDALIPCTRIRPRRHFDIIFA